MKMTREDWSTPHILKPDLVSAPKHKDPGMQRPLSSASSCSFVLMQRTKDACQESDAAEVDMTKDDWFIPRILKPDPDIHAPHDAMASCSVDRRSSPNGRLSSALHSEMRGNDLVYLDVKELAQDLEPNKRKPASSISLLEVAEQQASISKAGAQCQEPGFDLNVSLNLTQQCRSAAQQLSSRGVQDQLVQSARTQTQNARGFEHALNGDLRGLEQEFQEVSRGLEILRAGLQSTPRMGFRNCFTPRI